MKINNKGLEEIQEQDYLQVKLTRITEDEVLDFYVRMSLAPTAGGFAAHCEHDTAIERSKDGAN